MSLARRIHIFDDFLPEPEAYKVDALSLEFRSYELGGQTFHGIAIGGRSGDLSSAIAARFSGHEAGLTFFRKSPEGQMEPNFIHSDDSMGDWTGILYLNENPDERDGTSFWRHVVTGMREGSQREYGAHWKDKSMWESWAMAKARFNRLVIFPAPFFHSRGIIENYGHGDDSRLIQVVFGKGPLIGYDAS